MSDNPNTIRIHRQIDGIAVEAQAVYFEQYDGWQCRVRLCGARDWLETRGPQDIHDAPSELWDMIELTISEERSRHASNAGPYSDEQCGRF